MPENGLRMVNARARYLRVVIVYHALPPAYESMSGVLRRKNRSKPVFRFL